jgi:hypothetical protein
MYNAKLSSIELLSASRQFLADLMMWQGVLPLPVIALAIRVEKSSRNLLN